METKATIHTIDLDTAVYATVEEIDHQPTSPPAMTSFGAIPKKTKSNLPAQHQLMPAQSKQTQEIVVYRKENSDESHELQQVRGLFDRYPETRGFISTNNPVESYSPTIEQWCLPTTQRYKSYLNHPDFPDIVNAYYHYAHQGQLGGPPPKFKFSDTKPLGELLGLNIEEAYQHVIYTSHNGYCSGFNEDPNADLAQRVFRLKAGEGILDPAYSQDEINAFTNRAQLPGYGSRLCRRVRYVWSEVFLAKDLPQTALSKDEKIIPKEWMKTYKNHRRQQILTLDPLLSIVELFCLRMARVQREKDRTGPQFWRQPEGHRIPQVIRVMPTRRNPIKMKIDPRRRTIYRGENDEYELDTNL
jgi:hypothetical protein